jgi:hypothetical protein
MGPEPGYSTPAAIGTKHILDRVVGIWEQIDTTSTPRERMCVWWEQVATRRPSSPTACTPPTALGAAAAHHPTPPG